jgi:hypothetical protein
VDLFKYNLTDSAQTFSDDFDEETVLQLECGQVSEKVERQV